MTHRETSPTFGDHVRVRDTPETRIIGVASAEGMVSGFTTPSVTGVDVVGETIDDVAFSVLFERDGRTIWFAPQLLEFLDHAPGTELWVQGSITKVVRLQTGEWLDVPLAGSQTATRRERSPRQTSNDHHARLRRRFAALFLTLAAIIWLPIAFMFLTESWAADRCLDGAGSFDYVELRCDQQENHPFVPFDQRHQLAARLRPLSISASLGLLIGAIVAVRSNRRSAG